MLVKVKIKSYYGEFPSYLTLGKVYEVIDCFDDRVPMIQDDVNSIIYIGLEYCQHLNGGSWEIVK